jgi:putative transposase
MSVQDDLPWHQRRPARLRGYDYTQPGWYFVTICVQDRACVLGSVCNGKMDLNDAGRMIEATWAEMPLHYPRVRLDQAIVMPNHLHGVIVLEDAAATGDGRPQGAAPTLSLPDIVDRFKTLTTRLYIDAVRRHGWQPFAGRLWQRSYYDHVIRDEHALSQIRDYIVNNPIKWEMDPDNPARQRPRE